VAVYPDIAAVRAWIGVPATAMPDELLQPVCDAESAAQAQVCTIGDTLSPDLSQAFLRRVARHVAARGVPLGLLNVDAEFGSSRLSRWDAEVERLEAPYRMVVLG
jgi:hypothetical protein